MMTKGKTEYSHHPQDTKSRRMQLFWKIIMVLVLVIFFQNHAAAGEKLKAGVWKGTFLTHDKRLYKVKYIVSYGDDAKKAPLKIKMINLDLEPASEFTYKLKDIEIKKKKIQFKIPKEFETKECTLEKVKNSYSGTCSSTASDAEEVSEITMEPPKDDPPKAE